MAGFVAATVLFLALAALVLRWARHDLRDRGALSGRSAAASWLLYVFHADTVASAAWAQALTVDAPRAPAIALGVLLGVFGSSVFLAGSVALVHRGDFRWPRTHRLVTTGVYGLSRHPQNVGWGIMLLGFAVGARSVVAVVLVALFAVFVERYSRLEEAQLEEDFGEEYTRYRERTAAIVSWSRPAARERSPSARSR